MKIIRTFPDIPDSIEVKQVSTNKARIIAYPFAPGYAITLAHPMRRLILSSSVGYSIIGIEIDGVSHEFDSIKGMAEDVSLFIINLKKLRFYINNSDENIITVSYSFSGEKVISGSDLETDNISVVNKDIYIATINSDIVINFSIIVSKGIGYIPSEDIRDFIPDSFISVDAFFTPVVNVIYNIENILIRDDPNYEKLIFDIETDGRITAVEAFKNAVDVMQNQINIFNKSLNINNDSSFVINDNYEESKVLLQTIDNLNLSARCYNCLNKIQLKYIGELVLMKDDELINIKNLGKKSYDEIVEKINALGYKIGDSIPANIEELIRKKTNKV